MNSVQPCYSQTFAPSCQARVQNVIQDWFSERCQWIFVDMLDSFQNRALFEQEFMMNLDACFQGNAPAKMWQQLVLERTFGRAWEGLQCTVTQLPLVVKSAPVVECPTAQEKKFVILSIQPLVRTVRKQGLPKSEPKQRLERLQLIVCFRESSVVASGLLVKTCHSWSSVGTSSCFLLPSTFEAWIGEKDARRGKHEVPPAIL